MRALSGAATETTEEELVLVARGATGAQLDTVVRQWRRNLVGGTTASSPVRRSIRRRIEDDGSSVYTVRVSPLEGPVVDKALGLAGVSVVDDAGNVVAMPEEVVLTEAMAQSSAWERSAADAFVLMASSFLASGPSGKAGTATW